MSARRMAAVQPESFALSKSAHKEIDMWVAKYPSDRQRAYPCALDCAKRCRRLAARTCDARRG